MKQYPSAKQKQYPPWIRIGIIPVVICREKPVVVSEDNFGGSFGIRESDEVLVSGIGLIPVVARGIVNFPGIRDP